MNVEKKFLETAIYLKHMLEITTQELGQIIAKYIEMKKINFKALLNDAVKKRELKAYEYLALLKIHELFEYYKNKNIDVFKTLIDVYKMFN